MFAGLMAIASTVACTFPVEVTSHRTALENQVLGSHQELDEELVLVSSVRSPRDKGAEASSLGKKVLRAKQLQEFNRDDIDELKDSQVIGETNQGVLTLLPKDVGMVHKAKPETVKLATLVIEEENRSRQVIWMHRIATNDNLQDKDLPGIRRTFAKTQWDTAKAGHWFQAEDGGWRRKTVETHDKEKAEGTEGNA